MRVLDLFAGTGSATQAFQDRGHEVVRVELDTRFDAEIHADILTLTPDDLPGPWDFIWASPPCTAFSVASMARHWHKVGEHEHIPKSDTAHLGIALVRHTLSLIRALDPPAYLIENPRGLLRKFPEMLELERRTVTYCTLGDNTRMKPTDLWGTVPGLRFPPPCDAPPRLTRRGKVVEIDGVAWRTTIDGEPCHHAAPRGARTGTQGLADPATRSMIPYGVSDLIERYLTSSRGGV